MTLQCIGDYELIKQIEKNLFLAEHHYFKRPATLRLLSREMAEMIAPLPILDHPHIVKIQNISCTPDQCYMVSDYIEGKTLNSKEFFSQEEIPIILQQIGSALDYAHERKRAHLGLKLSSIILSQEGVYLSDFGLFKNEEMIARSHIPFLSPEQMAGEEGDEKSDLFAFGAIAYYLLMGKYPGGLFEMPPSPWDQLITFCLQSDPQKRPPSIRAALEHLKSPRPHLKPQEIARPEFDADPAAIFQTDSTVGKYVPKEEETKKTDPLLTEMVIVPSGTYMRGSNEGGRDEMPRHSITISDFAIDIHPVTNEQFVRFLEVMGGEKDVNNNEIIRLRDSRIKRAAGKISIETGYLKHPVVGITWYGALAYAKWIGKRLPTEAEWEIAASGGEDKIYPTGENIDRTEANFFSSDTTAVMSYPPNKLGLYDMAGNVYEWCQDWYDYHYYDISRQEPNNPQGPLQGVYRVLRGGCWKSLKEDLRSAHRHRNNPGTMNGTYGFRCVADVS